MKCYLCNKEKKTIEEVYNRYICKECQKELNKYVNKTKEILKTK